MNEQSVFSFSESNSTDQKSLKIKWNSVQNPATAMSEGRSMTIGTGKLLYGTCHDLNTVNSLIATPFRKQPPPVSDLFENKRLISLSNAVSNLSRTRTVLKFVSDRGLFLNQKFDILLFFFLVPVSDRPVDSSLECPENSVFDSAVDQAC